VLRGVLQTEDYGGVPRGAKGGRGWAEGVCNGGRPLLSPQDNGATIINQTKCPLLLPPQPKLCGGRSNRGGGEGTVLELLEAASASAQPEPCVSPRWVT
jgi:hypothetical protein